MQLEIIEFDYLQFDEFDSLYILSISNIMIILTIYHEHLYSIIMY
jgi:hypothetical protein